jgi:pantothenate kinase
VLGAVFRRPAPQWMWPSTVPHTSGLGMVLQWLTKAGILSRAVQRPAVAVARAAAWGQGVMITRSVPELDGGDAEQLVRRARRLLDTGQRRILGVVGAPGAGKSTLAAGIVARLGPRAALVPMDGFHLAEHELHRLGLHDRKGAIETFDGGGFTSLLRRLRDATEDVVYAPEFRREIEEPVAGAIPVSPGVSLVVTEGNYLLVTARPWDQLRELIDEVWYLELDEDVRLARLVERHIAYGRSRPEAEARARGSDQLNADLIAATRPRADLIVAGTVRLRSDVSAVEGTALTGW